MPTRCDATHPLNKEKNEKVLYYGVSLSKEIPWNMKYFNQHGTWLKYSMHGITPIGQG